MVDKVLRTLLSKERNKLNTGKLSAEEYDAFISGANTALAPLNFKFNPKTGELISDAHVGEVESPKDFSEHVNKGNEVTMFKAGVLLVADVAEQFDKNSDDLGRIVEEARSI